MTNHDIAVVLQNIRPGAHWVMTGETYGGLVWLDDPSTQPTAEELGL